MSEVGFELTVFLLPDTDSHAFLSDYIAMIESHGVYTGGRGPQDGHLDHYVTGENLTLAVRSSIVGWCDSHPNVTGVHAGMIEVDAWGEE